MKKTLGLLLLLLVLGAVYYVTNSKDSTTSVEIADRDFILEQPEDVEVVVLEYKRRPAIHLSKKEDGWYINNKQKANDRIVQNMLSTMNRMSIQYIPTEAEKHTAIDRMALHGINVKTYNKQGKAITEFIVGTNTNTEYGTYCMIPGAQKAYVMSIPALQGGIRNYFTQTQEEMRELVVFAYEPNGIKKITIDYPKSKINSFTLEREGTEFKVSCANPKGEVVNNIVDAYFKDFNDLVCETVMKDHQLKDSVITAIPFMEMKIEAQNKPPYTLKIYPILDMTDTSVNTRSPDDLTKYHQKYAAYSSTEDFYIIQNRFIRRYFKKPSYFYRKAS